MLPFPTRLRGRSVAARSTLQYYLFRLKQPLPDLRQLPQRVECAVPARIPEIGGGNGGDIPAQLVESVRVPVVDPSGQENDETVV